MKKINKRFNLQIGDKVEVGLNSDGEILESENSEWVDTAIATVVGSEYGSPVFYFDDKEIKKHKNLNTNSMAYNESYIDSSQKDKIDINDEQFFINYHTWMYNKVGEARPKHPIEEKFGVKIGDKIKVAVTKQNKLCSSTGSKSGKFATGRVVGGSSNAILVQYDDVNISDTISGLTTAGNIDYDIHDSFREEDSITDAIDNDELTFSYVYSKKAFEKIEEAAIKEDNKMVEPLPMTEERSSYVPKLGDKVLVERDETGRLIDRKSCTPDKTGKYKPAVCTVVGLKDGRTTVMVDDTTECGAPIDSYTDYIDASHIDQADKEKKYWHLFDYKPTPITLWGLQVGDEVMVGKNSYKELIDEDSVWSGKGVQGKVIGFEMRNGKAVAPLIYIDHAALKKSKIKTRRNYDSDFDNDIAFRFLNDKTINKEKGCFWYVYDQSAFKKVETKERDNGVKMSNVQSNRPEFWDMIKDDGKSALYRVAATQSTKGVKAAILTMMQKQGSDSGSLKALEEVLETEFGTALVSAILGMGLTYMPKVSEDPRVAQLATELRVNSMGTVGNAVMEIAIEHFLPVISGALNSIPAEGAQVRVGENAEEQEQEEEKQVEGKRASA